MTVFHGRRVGPLLTVWVAALVLAGALYWLQSAVPAIIDILPPFYVLLAVVALVSTWRWFRHRHIGTDRRHGDRRRTRRRHPFRREHIAGSDD